MSFFFFAGYKDCCTHYKGLIIPFRWFTLNLLQFHWILETWQSNLWCVDDTAFCVYHTNCSNLPGSSQSLPGLFNRLELHRLRNLSVSELLFRLLHSHSTRVKITLGDYGQHPAFTQGSNLPKWQGLQIEPRTSDPQPRAISITSLCLLHINGAQPTLISFL